MANSAVTDMVQQIKMLEIRLDMLTDPIEIQNIKLQIADLREKIAKANIQREIG